MKPSRDDEKLLKVVVVLAFALWAIAATVTMIVGMQG